MSKRSTTPPLTTRMTKAVERLARDICYNGFARPQDAGCSKVQYWERLSPEKRAEYVQEASWFCYTIRRLGRAKILTILDNNIE